MRGRNAADSVAPSGIDCRCSAAVSSCLFSRSQRFRRKPVATALTTHGISRTACATVWIITSSSTTACGSAEGIAFSYITGISKDLESMHHVFILDTATLEVRHAGPARTVPRDSGLFQQYFAGYKSPFTDNPGIIGITELKTDVRRDVDEAYWKLPRRWYPVLRVFDSEAMIHSRDRRAGVGDRTTNPGRRCPRSRSQELR